MLKENNISLADNEISSSFIASVNEGSIFRILFQNMNMPALVFNPQTAEILAVNQAARVFYGYSQDEWAHLRVSDVFLASSKKSGLELVLEKLTTGELTGFCGQHRLANGSIRDVEIQTSVIQFGGQTAIVAILQNGNGDPKPKRRFPRGGRLPRRGERAPRNFLAGSVERDGRLPEREEHVSRYDMTGGVPGSQYELGKIVDAIPGMVCILRMDGTLEYINQTFLNYIGISLEQMQGHGWVQSVHPEDFMLAQKTWARDYKEEGVFEVELRLRGADWKYRWFFGRSMPMLDENGGAIKFVALFVDITNRKQAESALLASEENTRLLTNTSRDAIFITSPEGSIYEWNSAANDIFGWSDDELKQKNRIEILDPLDPRLETALNTRKETGFFTGELTGLRKDGSRFPVEVSTSMFLDVNGNARSSIFVKDISTRKELEESLAARVKELTCLSEVGRLVELPEIEQEYLFQHVLEQIIQSMQFPQDASAAIEYGSNRTNLGPFEENLSNKLSSPLHIAGKLAGAINIYYPEERVFTLPNEQIMLDNLANMLELWLERMETDKEIRKLSKAMEQSPLSIMITSPERTIEYVNPGFTFMTGFTPEDAIGNTPKIVASGATPEKVDNEILDTIIKGQVWQGEICNQKKNGTLFWVNASIAPIRDANGKITHFIGINQDITEQRENQALLVETMEFNQRILEASPVGICIYNESGQCISVNSAAARIIGVDAGQLLAQNYHQLEQWKTNGLYDTSQKALQSHQPVSYRFYEKSPLGRELWINATFTSFKSGIENHLLMILEDDSDRQKAEISLKSSHDKLTNLVNSLEKSKHEADLLRQMSELLQICLSEEEAFAVILDYGPTMFEGSCGVIYRFSEKTHQMEQAAVWGESLLSETSFSVNECWSLRRGQLLQVSSNKPGLKCKHMSDSFIGSYLDIPLMVSGENPELLHIEWAGEVAKAEDSQNLAVILAENISLSLSNVRLRHTLQMQSVCDPLTGAFNRRYLSDTLNKELPQALRKNHPVSVIMLDIDHFKKFNDTFGHAAGDHILVMISGILSSLVRGNEIVCRMGGEEFIVLLPGSAMDMALQRAEEIRKEIAGQILMYEGRRLGMITVSLGVSVFPEHGSSPSELLDKADKALYRAKGNGRNRVEAAGLSL